MRQIGTSCRDGHPATGWNARLGGCQTCAYRFVAGRRSRPGGPPAGETQTARFAADEWRQPSSNRTAQSLRAHRLCSPVCPRGFRMGTLVNRSPTPRSQCINAAKRCNFRQHFEEIVESLVRSVGSTQTQKWDRALSQSHSHVSNHVLSNDSNRSRVCRAPIADGTPSSNSCAKTGELPPASEWPSRPKAPLKRFHPLPARPSSAHHHPRNFGFASAV